MGILPGEEKETSNKKLFLKSGPAWAYTKFVSSIVRVWVVYVDIYFYCKGTPGCTTPNKKSKFTWLTFHQSLCDETPVLFIFV